MKLSELAALADDDPRRGDAFREELRSRTPRRVLSWLRRNHRGIGRFFRESDTDDLLQAAAIQIHRASLVRAERLKPGGRDVPFSAYAYGAARLGILNEWRGINRRRRREVSIEVVGGLVKEISLDRWRDDCRASGPEEAAEYVAELLRVLDPRSAEIVSRTYGMLPGPTTRDTVGARLRISGSRVTFLLKEAQEKLRRRHQDNLHAAGCPVRFYEWRSYGRLWVSSPDLWAVILEGFKAYNWAVTREVSRRGRVITVGFFSLHRHSPGREIQVEEIR